MQTYNEFLSQFHHEEEIIFQEDSHVHYAQLLNQLKLNKEKKLTAKKKFKFQSSRLKTSNNDSPNPSVLQKSMRISKISDTSDTYQQKRSLLQLDQQSLQKQIVNSKSGFQKLKVEKQLLEEQLQIINKKQLQISLTLCESKNSLEQLRLMIREQKQANDSDFISFDNKICELAQRLENINEQNLLNAKNYEYLTVVKAESKHKSLLGSILSWQSEESKLKKLPKKLYTKTQIQSMFQALFIVSRLSELNYGNIIEHLINLSQPANIAKSQFQLFINEKGEQISITQLIARLQTQLLTPNECKFLSKTKIIDFYAAKGILIQSEWEPANLSPETLQLIKKVVNHFQNLTSWFSRIEKRNLQLSENFRSLIKIDEQLQKQIKSIETSAAQKSINYLQSREQQIDQLHQKLNSACKVIFLFNINIHDLIRRLQNLNKFFDKIVKSTNRRTHRKTFVECEDDTDFLKKINKALFKSPQCIIMDWNKVMNRTRNESNFISTGQIFQEIPQNDMYFETVMTNDLLRIYAQPSMFDRQKSYIDNLKDTFDYVIEKESQIIDKLCVILQDLLLFSKKGLIEYQVYRNEKTEKKKFSVRSDEQTKANLDPLLRLLQQSNVKMDKFFARDQIKEEAEKPQEGENFCVESNEFYRRDNFKLIQKLEKLDLKRKGLLPSVPFAVNTSLELEPMTRTVEDISLDKENSRFGSRRNSYRKRQPRLSHQMVSTRHNMVSERREFENCRKRDLKNLLRNISSIASENNKYRIRTKQNCQQEMLSTSTSRVWANRGQLESLTRRDKNK